jgi:hypothetical protein
MEDDDRKYDEAALVSEGWSRGRKAKEEPKKSMAEYRKLEAMNKAESEAMELEVQEKIEALELELPPDMVELERQRRVLMELQALNKRRGK